MHILYLHQYFCPPDGAGGTRSYEIARRLIKRGHKVTMITSSAFFPDNYKFQTRENIYLDGIELLVCNVKYNNSMNFNRRVFAFIEFIFKSITLTLKTKNTDLIFATSTPLTIIIPAFIISIIRNNPIVFEVRDLWPELPIAVGAIKNPILKFLTYKLEKFAYIISKRIIALSPGMKDSIEKKGVNKSKISIVPNGCDIDLFQRHDSININEIITENKILTKPIVLYAGTFGVINDLNYIIGLANESLKLGLDINFLLCGDGLEKDHIIRRAKKTNTLNKNLWILDSIPKTSVPTLMNIATVSISVFKNIPEMQNNSANKFFDSIAAGKPIIINYKGWQAKLIESAGIGLVLPYKDKKNAIIKLNKFINSKKRLSYAQLKAQQLSKGKFNRERQFFNLVSILENSNSLGRLYD